MAASNNNNNNNKINNNFELWKCTHNPEIDI